MSETPRISAPRDRHSRANVRQALLKLGSAHLYPGIPPGEWQPAAVMADMVRTMRAGTRRGSAGTRDRLLDERHFEFRGRLSAGARDDQRRARLQDRQERRLREQK